VNATKRKTIERIQAAGPQRIIQNILNGVLQSSAGYISTILKSKRKPRIVQANRVQIISMSIILVLSISLKGIHNVICSQHFCRGSVRDFVDGPELNLEQAAVVDSQVASLHPRLPISDRKIEASGFVGFLVRVPRDVELIIFH